MLAGRSHSGFTLIELMITLAIVALVLLAGLPGITEWIQNSQIRTAAEGIQNGMSTARTEAVRRNTHIEFVLTNPKVAGGTGWLIQTANGNTAIQSKPDGEGSRSAVVTPTPTDATTITFNGFGRVVANADASESITSIAVDSNVLDAAKSRDLKIEINSGGEARMCDPNVSDTLDPRICKT